MKFVEHTEKTLLVSREGSFSEPPVCSISQQQQVGTLEQLQPTLLQQLVWQVTVIGSGHVHQCFQLENLPALQVISHVS